MTDTPLFTVTTLCYNHAPFLSDYFDGLLSQTYSNVQVIIQDDCSTDGSWDIIQSYRAQLESKFPDVAIERSERNLGMWGAIQRAMDKWRIRGEYLSLLESDDYYAPTRIEKVIAFFQQNPEVQAVHGNVYYVTGSQKRFKDHYLALSKIQGQIFDNLLEQCFIVQCSFACRAELFKQLVNLEKFEARGYRMADYPIELTLAKHAKFGFIPEPLSYYRVRENSVSRPTSCTEGFLFKQSARTVARDFTRDYEVSEQVRDRVERLYHEHLFSSGYHLGLAQYCTEGYSWLVRHYPQKYRNLIDQARAIAVHYPLLWKVVKAIEQTGVVGRARRFLKAK